ncbi:zinc finger GRF-type containing 1 [Rhinolophus ferrumequinum]|uniref:5'-3' DNA helicase ZGRF1 n=1 Tax=Rhinolophus ferrumequinum TaxID=59479 RepID=A0A7J7U3M9_RHIFE|nr:zinc finger GRF-type containing 1 [Rhinolophus ferrumequinum]
MESQEFIVLYTHQKMKKSKVWQDGILKIPHIGNKAILYDDKGECLESLFLKCLKVKPGDDLESDRYLITVEEVQVAGSIALPQDVVKEAPDSNSRRCLPSGRTLGCRPAGLKRKFAGVQGPHQVPKKVVITEDGASAVSAEAKMCGPGFLSPFYSTPPLFSAGSVPTDRENTDTCRSGASSGRPSSAAASAPSGRTCPETLCEENHFCSPVSSVNKHSDSLLTNEPTKRASLASPCLGLSQSTRSKAQIVALLKSSAGVSEQVKPEATERFPQGQTQGGLKIATKPECFLEQVECAEVRKESLHDQRQSESTVKSGSQWAVRSSLQSSPVHSPAGGNNPERKPTAPGDRMNLHLEELLVQKEIQFFETCAENAEMSNEDKLVDNNYQSWGQKGTLEITSFCESNSPPVARGNVENDGSLSESDIQEDIKMPVKQNDQMCVEGSLLTREDAREANLCGSPGKGYKQAVSGLAGPERLQSVSLLREQSSISAAITGVFSTSDAAGGSLPTVHEPERHVTQPVLEVTFNLNNFETSDTEEESQESNAISQESGRWGQETLGNDRRPGVQRRCEDESREAIGSEHWLHLTSVGDKPAETFPVEETLPAQFCGQTRVGLDPGVWKAGNTGEEPEEDGGSDSALEWIGGPYNEDANKSVQKVGMNYDFASLPNQSKGKTSNLRLPQFLNMAPNQAPENSRTSERAQPQPSTMGIGKQWISVVPRARPTSPHLNQDSQQPVEFQGHRVKGSASSAVMIRGQIPGGAACENCTPDICFLAPERPSTCMQADFLQVTSPEQKMSPVSPVSTVSLDSRDEDLVLELSADALKARTLPVMTQFSSVETKNFQRLPSVSRMRLPLITGPADVGPRSHTTGCDKWEASAAPTVVCEGATVPSFSFGPEDQSETRESREVTSADTSLLDHVSSQSKWLKYQNLPQCNSTAPSRADRKFTDGFLAEATSGPCSGDTGERHGNAVEGSQLGAVRLQVIKSVLRQQQLHFSGQGLLCRKQALSLNLKQTSKLEELPNLSGEPACYEHNVTGGAQEISGSELCFPSGQKIKSSHLPQRHVRIPAHFQSPAQYRQVFASCLREHLNILLFGLAQRLHKALSKVDISFYMSSKGEKLKNVESSVPSCHHHQPAKLVVVQKDGPNKGRLFYTCDAPKADRCKFFKWLEKETPGNLTQKESPASMVLSDIKSIGLYLRSQTIPLYEECQLLVRKGFDFQRKQSGKLKRFTTVHPGFYSEPNSKLYLKLSRKESSSTYSKDDLWVVSKTLDFELDTFIACSAFFGPSSTNELEILPLRGYCPSNWPTNTVVHALLVCNASTELTTLKNIEDHFNPATLPLTWHLLTLSSSATVSNKRVSKRKFIPPALSTIHTNLEVLSLGATLQIARELIRAHTLNLDQAAALTQIAHMMASHDSAEDKSGPPTRVPPITVIQGVFGAGKSYLLAVVILFFVQLFEKSEAPTVGNSRPWKVLISSSTNVAVDRVLLGLLSLGFEKFVRVGSVRKIAKPVLPYSLHAGSENASEQLKELHALMKEDLTPMERVYVRKSIEQHKLGTNRNLLKQVRVVGVTCAACPFPCMNDLKFPVVVLDECSQMTEPTALLPIARFECEKLILVGDPKQLPPTIQASEAAHENGLEQTLFDRLCLMGHKPVLLRTQYRCHPAISAVANDLFYAGNLRNGVSEAERGPLVAWLPTLCFYHVSGAEQIERGSSFHNAAEAAFTLKLIQSLIASGVAGSVIGVITLYKAQMYKLCHLLSAVDFDQPEVRAVQVSTVDAFQGAEKEIIILSCVRTRQVGFIDSEKRMNVALTRGRRHLLIVGNLACLRKNHLWGRVIQHCEGREDGLQHARQCEAQLDHLLRDYFEKQAEEKQKKKSEKDKCKD